MAARRRCIELRELDIIEKFDTLKNAVKIKMQIMSDGIMSDKTRDFWSEIRKLKVHNIVMSNSIDGCNDNDDIMNVFRDKYKSLYNSVPYD